MCPWQDCGSKDAIMTNERSDQGHSGTLWDKVKVLLAKQ